MPAGFLCVFTLKLQLEKTNGAPKASKRIKGFFMAFTFARKEGPAQWGIQPKACRPMESSPDAKISIIWHKSAQAEHSPLPAGCDPR
jgi:hypothetical protein